MNRRQKIIVSVTGIFLVLLLLVGLTYAYFLTKISGNTNTKSISVKTANLALVYGDGNGVLEVGEVITPGNSIKFKTASGDTVDSKTFTVTNKGNATTDYVVVIEDVKVTYTNATVVDGVSYKTGAETTFESNDFRYTLTCTTDGSIACSGVENEVFPMSGGIVVGNNLEVGKTHTYTLTMEYLETNKDQSNDMNKSFTAKLNIKDISTINPYSSDTSLLAYNIINNSIVGKNGTTLKAVPDTNPAEEISWTKSTGRYEEQELDMSTRSSWTYADTYLNAQPWNGGGSPTGSVSECSDTIVGKYISYYNENTSWYVKSCKSSTIAIVDSEIFNYESELSVTTDDYGTSYYYRGNVEDNYVNFAGMCWKVVRVAGDGSTKLILEDKNTTCESSTYTGNWSLGEGNYGYDREAAETKEIVKMNYLNSSMVKAFYDFQTTNLASYTDKLKAGSWCLGDAAYTRTGSSTSDYTYTLLEDTSSYYSSGTTFYYDAYVRLSGENKDGYNATLKCNGTKLEKFATVEGVSSEAPMYVSALTVDEIVYAGGRTYNKNYYLINKENLSKFLSLSPNYFSGSYDYIFYVSEEAALGSTPVMALTGAIRPTISLASSAKITSGDGTQNNPYKVG